MMQGDACNLGIRIENNAGKSVTPSDIRDLEITIGHLRKTFGKNQLVYSSGLWFFPLSQQETQSLFPSAVKAQVRVQWPGGVIEGKPLLGLRIRESICKEVL